MQLGGALLEAFNNLSVDVKNPEVTVSVEIRDTKAYIHAENIKGAGGLPVGSSGKAMLLLDRGASRIGTSLDPEKLFVEE